MLNFKKRNLVATLSNRTITYLSKLQDQMKINGFKKTLKSRRFAYTASAAVSILFITISLILPAITAHAEQTLTWTSNGDFQYNKVSDCSELTLENLSLTGSSYADNTCAQAAQDDSLKLAEGHPEIKGATKVAAGIRVTLILDADGTIWSVGDNTSGQLGIGNTNSVNPILNKVKDTSGTGILSNVTDISIGENHACAVSSGSLYCWGDNGFGQLGTGNTTQSYLPTPASTTQMSGTVTAVTAGSSSTCAIADGKAYCWGNNTYGVIGNSSNISSYYPLPVSTGLMSGTVTAIATGSYSHTCAISDGKAYCWGRNNNGQLGVGSSSDSNTPLPVNTSTMTGTVTAIATGQYSTCAVADGKAYCWGINSSGQLGTGNTTSKNTPAAVVTSVMSGTVTDVSSAYSFSCAVADGKAYCWGNNSQYGLGNGTSNTSNTPVATLEDNVTDTLKNISGIGSGACSLGVSGYVYCWGNNTDGQLADVYTYGSQSTKPLAIKVNTNIQYMDQSVVSSTDSGYSACTIQQGKAYCWGHNNTSQLGNGSTTNSGIAVPVDTSVMTGTVTAISNGGAHTCAIADGKAYCWGHNNSGRLGDGTSNNSDTPVAVNTSVMTGTVTDISAGNTHTCAIADGKAYCWGYNSNGQLGTNSTTASNVPVAVNTSVMTGTVTRIRTASGNPNTCAVADGKAYCWGAGSNSVIGNGSTSTRTIPTAVTTSVMTGVVTDIDVGTTNACAIADGKAYCWGYGALGTVGYGSTSTTAVPLAVNTSVMTGTVTAISVGNTHACAVADGKAYCWGYNTRRQVGDGSSFQRNFPVAVLTANMPGTIISIEAGMDRTYVASDQGIYSWGSSYLGALGHFGYMTSDINRYTFPQVRLPLGINYLIGYADSGTLSGAFVDAGQGKKTKWYTIGWNTASLPANTFVAFSLRTSDDKTNWSAWTQDFVQDTESSTTGSGDLSSLALSRYVEIKMHMTSSDSNSSPELLDFSLSFLDDNTAPTANATNISAYKQKNGSQLAADSWTNVPTTYFTWDAAEDNNNGSGIQGYCLYLGQDNTADVTTTKGILGNSPIDTGGACQYTVPATELDLGTVGVLGTQLTTSNDPYYLLIKAIDYSGNIYADSAESFALKFDNSAPNNPFFVSAPSQFVSVKDVTLTWPTTGSEAASDANSGVAGLQYRIGSNGTWYGANHNGTQDSTDLLPNNGTYRTDETYDYPAMAEGNNIFYFRTYDQAGNVSESHITAVVKLNTSSPSSPQNVTASPTSSDTNSFAFSWLAPASFVGTKNGITYCYTVNTLPTQSNCNYTNAGQTSLPADAFATQPGQNTFYVVARDEAGNVNYDTYASATFTANTSAPGVPKDFEIADVSTKASSIWKIAVSWSAPEDIGAGVAKYSIYRSTNGTDYSQVASTSGLSYVDGPLVQQKYYYKIKSCDSANNCGAFSQVVSLTPTGRYTTPPELVGNVTSEVSTRTAKFGWFTDREADSRIQYGVSSGSYFAGEVTVSEPVKSHEVELYNLEAGTTYHYRVKWTDEDGNTGVSSELTFTTLPAPSIKDVAVVKKNLSSALIQFTSLDATKVELLYGKSDGFGGLVTVNTSRSESTYTVEITGLDDGTQYVFKLNTYDSEGNKYDSRRIDSFETPPRPRISNLRFQPIEGEPTSTQKVTWTTNVPTDSTVTYGKSGTNGTDVYVSEPKTEHEIIIRALEDDSDYFLLAQSRDQDGNLAVSDRQFFRTALDTRPPAISDIRVTTAIKGSGSDARGQIVVYWKTDEPATSQVAYAFGASGSDYPNRTAEDAQLTTEHVVIVSDLAVSNVYHLQPISKDKSDNLTSGDDKSAVIGRPTDSILNIILNSIQGIFGL